MVHRTAGPSLIVDLPSSGDNFSFLAGGVSVIVVDRYPARCWTRMEDKDSLEQELGAALIHPYRIGREFRRYGVPYPWRFSREAI